MEAGAVGVGAAEAVAGKAVVEVEVVVAVAEVEGAAAEPEAVGAATSNGPVRGSDRSPTSTRRRRRRTVMYQSEPRDGQQCTDCRFYIPDKNGDGLGACAVVEGKIEPQAWCSSFVQYEG